MKIAMPKIKEKILTMITDQGECNNFRENQTKFEYTRHTLTLTGVFESK